MEGWVKVYRKIEGHWIWNKPEYFRAWYYCLLRANYKDTEVLVGAHTIPVKRGQFITSIENFATRTNLTKQQARTFLDLLESNTMIVREATWRSTRITICNYDKYQDEQHPDNTEITPTQHPRNIHVTSTQHADNIHVTTDKESKERKESKKREKRKESKEGLPPTDEIYFNENEKPKKGKCLMRNSGVTREDIRVAFEKSNDLKVADPGFYFDQALGWSNGKGELRVDWVATVCNFARGDMRDGKMKTVNLKKREQAGGAVPRHNMPIVDGGKREYGDFSNVKAVPMPENLRKRIANIGREK